MAADCGVVGEVEGRVAVAGEHGGGGHELGGGHAVQVGVVGAHRVGERVGAHPPHPHPCAEPVRPPVDARREESTDSGAFLL